MMRKRNTDLGIPIAAAAAVLVVACGGEAGDDLEWTVLIPERGEYAQPRYSPDGTKLAYERVSPTGDEIWVANADGGGAIRVSAEAEDVGDMDWSPDGAWLAYAKDVGGPPFLVKVPAAGGDEVFLTREGVGIATFPQWSPDGSRIMYLDQGRGRPEVKTMNADGGDVRTLRSDSDLQVGYWSPDGTRIAYLLVEQGRRFLAVQTLDGGEEQRLVGEGHENFQEWSPDGTEIAYVSLRTGAPDIWTVPAAGGEPRQITRDIRADFSPRYSPDGKWIAFISERGGQDDVWLVPATGGEAIRVTKTPAEEEGLTWTPDGRGLTFVSSNEAPHVWKLDVVSGEATQLTFGTRDHVFPAVSPDGRWVAYDDEQEDIWVVSIDGGEPRQVTNRAMDEFGPQWSPDGRTIAYVTVNAGRLEIFVIPTEGGEARNLTAHSADDDNPRWSPDGTQIAFLSNRNSLDDLYVMPAGGGEARRLTESGSAREPQWSPDGRSILYRQKRSTAGIEWDLYVVDVATGVERQLTRERGMVSFAGRWSPDGTRIAYEGTATQDGNFDIYVMNADGSNRRQLTTHRAADRAPEWSTDGTQIYFNTERAGRNDLAVVPANGGLVRMLTETATLGESAGSASPDGHTIVFLRFDPTNQIVRVNVEPLMRRASRP